MEFEGTSSFDRTMAMDRTWNRRLDLSASDKRMPGWRQAIGTSKGIAQPWFEKLEVYRSAPFYKR